MPVTWDDIDDSNDGIEVEEANLCLMAKDDADEVTFSNFCLSCKKVEITFDSLLKDSEILSQKCLSQRDQLIEIKKQNEKLQKQNQEYLQTIQNLKLANLNLSKQKNVLDTLPLETFEKQNDSLKNQVEEPTNITMLKQTTETFEEENNLLKNQVKGLTKDITSFVKSTETFQKIIGSQKRMLDKTGIGFNISKKQELYKKVFMPKPDKKILVPIKRKECTFCRKHGHSEDNCFHKKKKDCIKSIHHGTNYQVKKKKKCSYCNKFGHHKSKCYSKNKSFKNTNPQGPKSIWVPKLLLTPDTGMYAGNQEKALVLGQWLLKAYDRG